MESWSERRHINYYTNISLTSLWNTTWRSSKLWVHHLKNAVFEIRGGGSIRPALVSCQSPTKKLVSIIGTEWKEREREKNGEMAGVNREVTDLKDPSFCACFFFFIFPTTTTRKMISSIARQTVSRLGIRAFSTASGAMPFAVSSTAINAAGMKTEVWWVQCSGGPLCLTQSLPLLSLSVINPFLFAFFTESAVNYKIHLPVFDNDTSSIAATPILFFLIPDMSVFDWISSDFRAITITGWVRRPQVCCWRAWSPWRVWPWRWVMTNRGHLSANPLQYLLGGVSGCKTVVGRIIAQVCDCTLPLSLVVLPLALDMDDA